MYAYNSALFQNVLNSTEWRHGQKKSVALGRCHELKPAEAVLMFLFAHMRPSECVCEAVVVALCECVYILPYLCFLSALLQGRPLLDGM